MKVSDVQIRAFAPGLRRHLLRELGARAEEWVASAILSVAGGPGPVFAVLLRDGSGSLRAVVPRGLEAYEEVVRGALARAVLLEDEKKAASRERRRRGRSAQRRGA